MEHNDYRKRFYDGYITTQWQYLENISQGSAESVGRVIEKYIYPHLPKDKSAVILDVACGAGHLLRYLQSRGYSSASGIDLGREQLKEARKLGVKNVEEADLFTFLKGRENEYDVITAQAVIEHLTKAEAVMALDLMRKALKPGGRVLVTTSNVMSIFDLECAFGDFTHELFLAPRSFSQLLRVCGFSNVRIYGIGLAVYDLRSMARNAMWWMVKAFLRAGAVITFGTGRSKWKRELIFDPMILGVGDK